MTRHSAERTTVARTLLRGEDVWQERLMDARDFASLCSRQGVECAEDHILHLWRLGFLRADLVTGLTVRQKGFTRAGVAGDGTPAFADLRRWPKKHRSFENSIARRAVPT